MRNSFMFLMFASGFLLSIIFNVSLVVASSSADDNERVIECYHCSNCFEMIKPQIIKCTESSFTCFKTIIYQNTSRGKPAVGGKMISWNVTTTTVVRKGCKSITEIQNAGYSVGTCEAIAEVSGKRSTGIQCFCNDMNLCNYAEARGGCNYLLIINVISLLLF